MGKARPSGPYATDMTGPGAWPEADEDAFTGRANELGGILTKVDVALATWQGHQATIFNGVHVWSGDASKAAGAAVEGATKAMQDHSRQLRDAIEWCKSAATTIVVAKNTITWNVTAAQQEIQSIEKTAAKNNQNPDGAIQTLVQREYKENADVVNTFAMAWGAKPGDLPLSPADKQGEPHPDQPSQGEQPGKDGAARHFARPDSGSLPSGIQQVPNELAPPAPVPVRPVGD